MDADRTDYLLRDSHHCGVSYGRFDHLRMIESLEIFEDEGDVLEIAIERGGIHTFEALILARYQMNSQVYYHRVRRIYDRYLMEYFRACGERLLGAPDQILSHNDITMMSQIMHDAEHSEGPERPWAERIVRRDHHRIIHETGEATNAQDLKASKRTLDELSKRFDKCEFVWDHADGGIHSLLLPEDQTEGGFIRLQVIESSGVRRLLGDESHILRRIPRRFQVARVFGDVVSGQTDLRREMTAFASEVYRREGGR